MPNLKIGFSINFVIIIIFSFCIIFTPAFAEKELSLTKTVDVKDQLLLDTLSDLQSYPQIFPEYIKSVELIDDKTAKFNVGSNGIFFDVETQYSHQSDGSYVVEVISGDLKGTRMITTLQKTWGYDGSADGGTIVNMKILLNTSGMLSLIAPSIPDQMILSNLDSGLGKFVAHTKSKSETQSATQDESWVKKDAKYWSQGSINDATFALGIQNMIKHGTVKMSQDQGFGLSQIPSWVKANAGWWADGKISDKDFHSTIQYLIDSKIMKVSLENS
ncbi:MAG: hypothetical protein E6L05_00420 [Thaumarchaeota archaeon]|nr:MAG: hypothetical protein E6L05_00420 [Nitrososphaerota archaeon]